MKRRAKGTGTIIKVKDTYYGRIMVKGKIRVIKLSTNRRESEDLWKKWLVQNIVTLNTEAVKHEVAGLWPIIKSNLAGSEASDDRLRMFCFINGCIVDWFAHHGIDYVEDIEKATMLSCLDELTKGKAVRTKRNYLAGIKQLFSAAGVKKPELFEGVKISGGKEVSREALTDDEIAKVLEAAGKRGVEWKTLVEIGLYTGLRLKDCVYLKAENCKGGVIQTEPFKTIRHGTIVRIPIHEKLQASLDALGVSTGYFLPELVAKYDRNGASGLEDALRRIFSVIGDTSVKPAGRNRKVSVKGFHALRATFITRLAERGVSLPIMESIAGHLNPRQTMHYTHPDEDVKKMAVSVLPNFENATEEEKAVFVHPEVQKVIDVCKKQIEDTIEKIMGKKVEVQITGKEIVGGSKWFFDEL